MAIFFRGMNEEETAELTMAMVHSGDTIDLSRIEGIKLINTQRAVWGIQQR